MLNSLNSEHLTQSSFQSLFGEFHRVEEKNYHVTLCGFSGHFIHCLNEFLHEGQITLAMNSNTCDEAIKELKEVRVKFGVLQE